MTMMDVVEPARATLHGLAKPLRVMLVDDHPILRAGLKTLLDAEPDITVVAEAGDGASALELARQHQLHVVVMDVSMPELGGADATQRMLEANPTLRVLALSAHEEPSFARTLLEHGAAGYALKRSACQELVQALRIVARGGTYVDPSLVGTLVTGQRRSGGASSVPSVSLSEREVEVIRLVARGFTSKEMATSLGLSPRTLETYKARAMSKLNLRSRADLISYASRSGWLRDE
jgi:DNA-binding NarL/FixJ family response regulator